MSKVIAVINQKGGVGKSTTAAALAAGLTLKGRSTLVIDMDAQANLSYTAGADKSKASVLGVLTGEVKVEDAIQKLESCDIIPAARTLAGADAFITETGKEYKLKEALAGLQSAYEYIVIDTPPALGILTVNALTACNSVVIPAQADIYSFQGIEELARTIEPVRKYCNPNLKIAGILLTRYNPRSILSRDMADAAERLAANLKTKVFKTTIREAVVVREAQLKQETLYRYAGNAKVTKDYTDFIEELLGEELEENE